jgi:NAD(P)-dependent dehydrogenase (short-subunit alcohol dehydrogenase family)
MAAFKNTDNTIVLVTGINNTGVGFAIAQALLTTPSHTKYTMILTARSLDRSKNAVELLKKGEGAEAALGEGGCEVVPMQVDIDDEESVEAFKHGLSERFGRLDVLINNAGM